VDIIYIEFHPDLSRNVANTIKNSSTFLHEV